MAKLTYAPDTDSSNPVPFLLPDYYGDLDLFLEKFHTIEDVVLWCNHGAPLVNYTGNAPNTPRISPGLNPPNWPDRPPLKYNTLYWPTVGASRFGYFLGLQNNETAKSWANNVTGLLKLDDGTNQIEVKVYKLCSRQITLAQNDLDNPTNVDGSKNMLSLVVFVDPRYWLQTATIGKISDKFVNNLSIAPSSGASAQPWSWTDLYLYLQTQVSSQSDTKMTLNLTLADLDANKIFAPDYVELCRDDANMANYLDAVTFGLGMRIVTTYDAKMFVTMPPITGAMYNNPPTFTNGYTTGRAGGRQFILGAPALSISYPLCTNYHQFCYGKRSAIVTKDPNQNKSVPTFCLNTTFYANVTNPNLPNAIINDDGTTNSNIGNATKCKKLSATLTDRWVAWKWGIESTPVLKTAYDVTFNGVFPWTPCGWDDYVEFRWGANIKRKYDSPDAKAADSQHLDHLTTTRVMSLPVDFGTGCNYSQDSNIYILEDAQWGYITSTATTNPDTPLPVPYNWSNNQGTTPRSPTPVRIAHKIYNTPWGGSLTMLDSYLLTGDSTVTPTVQGTIEVNAYDALGGPCGYPVGDRVLLLWSCQDNIWLFFRTQGKARFISGQLTSPLGAHSVPPASAQGSVKSYWDGYDPLAGNSGPLLIFDKTNIFSGTVGTYYLATYDPCTDTYSFSAMGCP